MIYYIRDEEGSLIGLKYNHDIYYYIKNLQEDIIGITDSNYNVLCTYEYDSWGKVISIKDNNGNIIEDTSHIGIINPFRYRSYYYDKETKLYYLNSRYYNPEWGRFINADGIIKAEANKYNLYIYCKNNPIKYVDYTGNSAGVLSDFFRDIANSWNEIQTVIAGALGYLATASPIVAAAVGIGTITYGLSQVDWTSGASNKNNNEGREHYVYTLINLGVKYDDGSYLVEYVGRTKNLNHTRYRHSHNRAREHLKLVPFTPEPVTYAQARGVEEFLIMKYGTLNSELKGRNIIHGVNPNSAYYEKYRNIAQDYLKDEDLTYVGWGIW